MLPGQSANGRKRQFPVKARKYSPSKQPHQQPGQDGAATGLRRMRGRRAGGDFSHAAPFTGPARTHAPGCPRDLTGRPQPHQLSLRDREMPQLRAARC